MSKIGRSLWSMKASVQLADDCGADLVVMGAYGHSRARDLIFGSGREAGAIRRPLAGITRASVETPFQPNCRARSCSELHGPGVDPAALLAWSRLKAEDYLKGRQSTTGKPETLAVISKLLRADRKLGRENAAALDQIIRLAYKRLAEKG
jgi:hypothetical protein